MNYKVQDAKGHINCLSLRTTPYPRPSLTVVSALTFVNLVHHSESEVHQFLSGACPPIGGQRLTVVQIEGHGDVGGVVVVSF